LAIVMPFCPAVMGPGGSRPPAERLPVPGCCDGSKNNSWEESVNAMASRVLIPAGFQVDALARVPYLSHGDNRRPLYSLDDAIFVLSINHEQKPANLTGTAGNNGTHSRVTASTNANAAKRVRLRAPRGASGGQTDQKAGKNGAETSVYCQPCD